MSLLDLKTKKLVLWVQNLLKKWKRVKICSPVLRFTRIAMILDHKSSLIYSENKIGGVKHASRETWMIRDTIRVSTEYILPAL